MTADRERGGPAESPSSVRVSVGLWSALAVFLAAQAVVSWMSEADLRRQLLAQRVVGSEQEAADKAQSLLLTNTGIAVLLAIVYAVVALLVFTRQSYARIAATTVVVAHVVVVLGAVSVSIVNLIVFVLAGAALLMLWTRTSADWLTGER